MVDGNIKAIELSIASEPSSLHCIFTATTVPYLQNNSNRSASVTELLSSDKKSVALGGIDERSFDDIPVEMIAKNNQENRHHGSVIVYDQSSGY